MEDVEMTKETLEGMAYKPSGTEQLRLSLTSDILLQSIVPRPSMDRNSTEFRVHDQLGTAFVRWIDAEIKSSLEKKSEGIATTVLHSGAILDGIAAMCAAMLSYGAGVLIAPEDRERVLSVLFDVTRKTADRALEHCDKTYAQVLAGITAGANEDEPQ